MTVGRILLGSFVALVVLLVLWSWQLLRPGPPIRLSKQTTYITEPLADDGLPDYVAYLNEKYSEGVTPENNAAIPLLRALGPEYLDAQQQDELYTRLGMQHPTEEAAYLDAYYGDDQDEALAGWVTVVWQREPGEVSSTQAGGFNDAASSAAWSIRQLALSRPWRSRQIPPLSDWLDVHQRQLDLVVEAAKLPRMYSPLLAVSDDYKLAIHTSICVPSEDQLDAAASVLNLRVMRHLGEGRYDKALSEITAQHQLARFCAEGPRLYRFYRVDFFDTAMNIARMAWDDYAVLAGSPDVPEEMLQTALEDLCSAPRWTRSAELVGEDTRLLAIDAALTIRDDPDSLSELGLGPIGDWLGTVSVDWNVVLDRLNDHFDQLVVVLETPRRARRQAAVDSFEQSLFTILERIPNRLPGAALSLQARSELMGDYVAVLFSPSPSAIADVDRHADSRLDLTIIAVALGVYRARHGEYPETLDMLVPELLPAVPIEVSSGNPFRYERRDDGYLLYGFGYDGIDNGGTSTSWVSNDIVRGEWASIDWFDSNWGQRANGDDFVIRVPIPAFEMPPRPTPAQIQ